MHERIFETGTNCLSDADRAMIEDFLSCRIRSHPYSDSNVLRVKMDETAHAHSSGRGVMIESIIFEMNFVSGHWRKVRRKKHCGFNETMPIQSSSHWDCNGNPILRRHEIHQGPER